MGGVECCSTHSLTRQHRSQCSTLRTSHFTSATDAYRGIVRVGPSAGLDILENVKIWYPCRELSHDSSDVQAPSIAIIPTNECSHCALPASVCKLIMDNRCILAHVHSGDSIERLKIFVCVFLVPPSKLFCSSMKHHLPITPWP